jgi:hypothetical protein
MVVAAEIMPVTVICKKTVGGGAPTVNFLLNDKGIYNILHAWASKAQTHHRVKPTHLPYVRVLTTEYS